VRPGSEPTPWNEKKVLHLEEVIEKQGPESDGSLGSDQFPSVIIEDEKKI